MSINYTQANDTDSLKLSKLQYSSNFIRVNSPLMINKTVKYYPKKLISSVEVLLLTSSIATYGASEYYNYQYSNDNLIDNYNKANDYRKYSKILAISTAGTFIVDILIRKLVQRNNRIKFQFAYNQPNMSNCAKTTSIKLSYKF